MTSNKVCTPQQREVDLFLQKHLNPTPGRPAQDVKDRILHWIALAKNPTLVISEANAKSEANARRKARQNIRRLLLRHPEVAAQLDRELRTKVTR